METMQQSVTKGAFAAMIGVSPPRLSHFLKDGRIHGDAIDGEGMRARIRPDIALAQLKRSLDPSQGFGANGKAATATIAQQADIFRAGQGAGAADDFPLRPASQQDEMAEQLVRERLRQQQIKTGQMERQEKAEAGIYMLTEEARRVMGRGIGEAFKVMEQGLADLASALAEEFGLPQRDLQKALTRKWRDVRDASAGGFRAERDATPELIAEEGESEDAGEVDA